MLSFAPQRRIFVGIDPVDMRGSFNSLFAGSPEGAFRAAILLGITATCRALGVAPEAYLAWAFTRLGTHRQHFALTAAQLTPAAYAASRAGT